MCNKGNWKFSTSNKQFWEYNWTQTHNHLVHKRTLNHLAKLAKWLSCVVSTYLYGAVDCMFLPCHVSFRVNPHSCSHLNFRFCTCFEQRVSWHSGNYGVWIHSEMRMFFTYIVFFNIFINILQVIWVLNKSFRIIKML